MKARRAKPAVASCHCNMDQGETPMTLQVTLPVELEDRLREEAERQGLSPDAVTMKLLDEHLPRLAQVGALQAMLEQWQEEDESSPEELPNDDFFEALDADRPSQRKLYPPELKGISW
jgi:hypothetical protein